MIGWNSLKHRIKLMKLVKMVNIEVNVIGAIDCTYIGILKLRMHCKQNIRHHWGLNIEAHGSNKEQDWDMRYFMLLNNKHFKKSTKSIIKLYDLKLVISCVGW